MQSMAMLLLLSRPASGKGEARQGHAKADTVCLPANAKASLSAAAPARHSGSCSLLPVAY